MTAEKIKTTSNGLSIVFSNLEGKIIATANTAEIANEIVRRWNYAESLAKERSDEFDVWKSKLSPSQKCTVHPPAGSGGSHGIYELTNDQLYDTFLAEKRKEGSECQHENAFPPFNDMNDKLKMYCPDCKQSF